MSQLATWIAAVGILITFSTLLGSALFRIGHLSARVEALETWRGHLRADMHEISDKMGRLISEMSALRTLVDERTERRAEPRKASG